MGLDINLYKVLTKSEVTKLKNKYDVTDLVYSEKDNCENRENWKWSHMQGGTND